MVFFPREPVSNTSINGSSIGLNRKKEVFIERLRYPLVLCTVFVSRSLYFLLFFPFALPAYTLAMRHMHLAPQPISHSDHSVRIAPGMYCSTRAIPQCLAAAEKEWRTRQWVSAICSSRGIPGGSEQTGIPPLPTL